MPSPKRVSPEMKQAMINAGTWALFVEKRTILKDGGMTAKQACDAALKEFMPEGNIKDLSIPDPDVKRPSISAVSKKEIELYEEEKALKVFGDDGNEIKAPGDYEGDAEKEAWDKAIKQSASEGGAAAGVSIEKQMLWVFENVDNPKVEGLGNAPCSGAWTMLKRCRNDDEFLSKFLLTILPKFLPKNIGEKNEDESKGFDGEDLVDHLRGITEIAEKAKIKEAV